MFKFYSKHKEDKYIYENFFYNIKEKKYLEIGACDGLMTTNTKFFEDNLDWNGILIEANPYQHKALIKNRPNNKIFCDLVSDIENTVKYYCVENEAISGVLDTLPQSHIEILNSDINYWKKRQKKIIELKTRTLQSILDECNINEINFLSLDVEGHEYNVLNSIDFEKTKIEVILVEMLDVNEINNNKIRHFLLNKNYIYHSNIGRNEVYTLNTFIPSKIE